MGKKPALAMLLFIVILPAFSLDIKMGLREVPPYVVVNPRTGSLSGLEYEILQAALAASGHHLVPIVMPLARLVQTFQDGGVQAAAPIIAAHQSGGILSRPYLEYRNVAMALASSGLKIKKIADLANYSLAAFQTASKVLGPEFALTISQAKLYTEEAQQVNQIRLLFSTRIQVVIGESKILKSLIQNPATGVDAKLPTVEYSLFPSTYYSAAFHDTRLAKEFDEGLATIRANGLYAKILAKYR